MDSALSSYMVLIIERVLSNNDIDRVLKTGTYEEKVSSAVDMFADNIQFLSDIKIVML